MLRFNRPLKIELRLSMLRLAPGKIVIESTKVSPSVSFYSFLRFVGLWLMLSHSCKEIFVIHRLISFPYYSMLYLYKMYVVHKPFGSLSQPNLSTKS